MQRRSLLSQSRHRQLCSELNRYGMHVVKDTARVLVQSDAARVLPIRLMADGLPAWAARLETANALQVVFHQSA